MYDIYNLTAWPFQAVPDVNFAKIWAGREKTKHQIEQLIQSMQLRPSSRLNLLWANFGMGKTHTLLHLHHLAQNTGGRVIPVYAAMPPSAKNFVDVYRAIVSALPYEHLCDQIVKVGGAGSGGLAFHPLFTPSPGVVNAILAMRKGDFEEASIARQWLAAQPGLSARERHLIKATYLIKKTEDAVNALTVLKNLAGVNGEPHTKVLIMLDEYQRIGELTPKVKNDINAGLHAFFNANAIGMDIILSFSFGKKENIEFLLSKELKSRAAPEPISMDVLTEIEAVMFFYDLLREFRKNPDDRLAFPFTREAIQTLVTFIAAKKALTPRRIMLFGDLILSKVDSSIEDDNFDVIDADMVKTILSSCDLSYIDSDD